MSYETGCPTTTWCRASFPMPKPARSGRTSACEDPHSHPPIHRAGVGAPHESNTLSRRPRSTQHPNRIFFRIPSHASHQQERIKAAQDHWVAPQGWRAISHPKRKVAAHCRNTPSHCCSAMAAQDARAFFATLRFSAVFFQIIAGCMLGSNMRTGPVSPILSLVSGEGVRTSTCGKTLN